MKTFYTILFFSFFVGKMTSETFTSIATGNWATGGLTVWSISPATDPDNVPDAGDDVIISSGHNITSTGNVTAKTLTINLGGTYSGTSNNLILKGNFTNNGTATNIVFYLVSANTTVTSSTPLTNIRFLIAGSTVNLSAGTQITCTATSAGFNMHNAAVFNNSGRLIIHTLYNGSTTTQPTFNNLNGGSVTMTINIPTPITTNNNANSTYNFLKTVTSIPNWIYGHLNLQGSVSTKAAAATLNVNGNLTINSGVTMNLNSNTLNLGGNLSNSGTISNLLNVNLNGTTAAQSISSSQSLAFNNLTTANLLGVTFTSGSHTITNSLTVSSGNLNTGANLITLVSDATKTAYIANSAGTMSGSMIIQRYLPARVASYAEFSSPVTSTTIDDWDDELYMTINTPANVAGYPGGDGYYGGQGEFWSVTQYNTATGTYDSILTGTALNIGKGYNIWVADDGTQFPGRALDTRGTPNMGTPSIMALYGADPFFPGWNLIGNPHAAFIDWTDVVAASPGASSYIQIYDGSGNYVDNFTEPELAPGQGFWVEVGSTLPINFPQSSKRTTTTSTFFRPSANSNYDLKLRLSSSSNPFYHEINLNFDDNSTVGFEKGKDITFLKSPKQIAPYIVFTDGNNKFIRNKMNSSATVVKLPLEISTPISGNYTIELMGLFSSKVYSEAYLLNSLTGEQIEIGDANSVTLYFEKGEVSSNYSLVLKKVNAPAVSPDGQAVSIFSTSDFINIKSYLETTQIVKIEVYNMLGQSVISTSSELNVNGIINLPISELKSEVYIVKVTTDKNVQYSRKIIVTK